MKRFLVLLSLPFLFVSLSPAQKYWPTPTFPIVKGGTSISYTHTFVARNDTVYCYASGSPVDQTNLPPKNVQTKSPSDTTVLVGAAYTKSADTINVAYQLEYTSDTLTTWSSLALGQDSSATDANAYTVRLLRVNQSQIAKFYDAPYKRIAAIGKTPSGGLQNKIGAITQVDIFKW